MARDKIVDLDPRKRLSKEAIERFKKVINELKFENTDSMIFIHVPKDGEFTFQAFNLDWQLIGRTQAMVNQLGAFALESEMTIDEESIDDE